MNPRSGDLQVATEDRPEGLSLQGCSNPLALCLSKGEREPLATASKKRLLEGALGRVGGYLLVGEAEKLPQDAFCMLAHQGRGALGDAGRGREFEGRGGAAVGPYQRVLEEGEEASLP